MTNIRTASAALSRMAADLRGASERGEAMSAPKLLELSVALRNLAWAVSDLEEMPLALQAQHLARIEASAARNVVPMRRAFHSDAAHGDGAVA